MKFTTFGKVMMGWLFLALVLSVFVFHGPGFFIGAVLGAIAGQMLWPNDYLEPRGRIDEF